MDTDDVKTLNVPQYESLTVAEILNFASAYPKMDIYLPDDIDLPKVPRSWLINVCTVVIGRPFKDWVSDRIDERNNDVMDRDGDNIGTCAKVAERIEGCTQVSSKCLFLSFL